MLPLQEWWANLQRLAQADEDFRTEDPIFTLLPYLEKMASSSLNSFDIRLDTTITCEKSLTLANECPIIDELLISRYLTYWKQIGYLNDLDLLPIPL
ncbi:hypothetical protein K7432_016227 [Basidiobolus ranarum]|uniref:Uncharacterized protein n=1 Tax=Basidiobolus ranarum TaxID=34480 RepID=A0ABR2VM48_9FUNG